jgi:hypothetical protein
LIRADYEAIMMIFVTTNCILNKELQVWKCCGHLSFFLLFVVLLCKKGTLLHVRNYKGNKESAFGVKKKMLIPLVKSFNFMIVRTLGLRYKSQEKLEKFYSLAIYHRKRFPVFLAQMPI